MQPNRPTGTRTSQNQSRSRFSFFPEDDSAPSTQQQPAQEQPAQEQPAQQQPAQQQPAQQQPTQESSNVGSSSFGNYKPEDRDYIIQLHEINRPGFVPPNFTASNLNDLQRTNAHRARRGLPPIRGVGFESGILPPINRPGDEATLPPINGPDEQATRYSFFPE